MLALLAVPDIASSEDFQTATVSLQQQGHTITVGGTVVPYKEVTLAAQIPGEIDFVAGAEGDNFTAEAVLVAVDDENLQAKRRAATAAIYSAEAALRNSQVQYSRELVSPRVNSLTTMPGMGMPSMFDQFFTRNFGNMTGRNDSGFERHADLYSQASSVNQAQSQLMQARASLEALDASLKDTRLLAPFDGVIVEKFVEVGDTVQPGQPLIRFAYTKYLRLRIDVPVRLVPNLEKGMLLPARLDVRGVQVMARIAQIYPKADAKRHTVTVKLDLPQGVSGGPGMYGEVRIPDFSGSSPQKPVVPASALVWRGSFPSVFILVDGKPSLRLVRVGEPTGDGQVSILAGLKGGEQVILNPPAGLTSGKAK